MPTMTDSRRDAVQLSDPHPTLTVYSTLTKRKEPFRTVKPGNVGVYLCGPTVYDKAHIGHMVGPVIFDSIKRYLTYCGYKVNWVVNITDVDDKLINKANQRGISMFEVAEENIADYHGNLAALGVDQIDHFPRATECMPEIIDFVQSLIDAGYAYESGGDVYFDVAKDAQYGKLSNRTLDQVQGDGGGGADRKRHAADFALWKSAKPGEPSWESPWAPGRPGWHIECSAMSKKLLGETFDIHGGGLDLVFPHHENEIAQSECCHGKPFATYWAHNGLLRRDASAGKIGGRAEREAGEPEASAPEQPPIEASSGKMSPLQRRRRPRRPHRPPGRRTHPLLPPPHPLPQHRPLQRTGDRRSRRRSGNLLPPLQALPPHHLERLLRAQAARPPRPAPPARPASAGRAPPTPRSKPPTPASRNSSPPWTTTSTPAAPSPSCSSSPKSPTATATSTTSNPAAPTTPPSARSPSWSPRIKELANILGLFLHPMQPPAQAGGSRDADLLAKVMQLVIDLRAEARKSKNFATADAIRDGLAPTGVKLEDRAGGTEWSGGGAGALDAVMQMLIQLRQTARQNKDFATGDAIRNRLADIGIKLEDRPGGGEWTRG